MIGVRFALHPMRDDFVPLILDAVRELPELGVEVETDDVSTCLLGEEPTLWEALRVAFGRAARSGSHVVLNATFSVGCPGEPEGDVCVPRAYEGPLGGEEGWSREAYGLGPVSVQFALYPLGAPDYMDAIYGEIERARQAGVRVVARHFCTHLYGSGDDVFATLRQAFKEAQGRAAHVVMTVAASANSPSLRAAGSQSQVAETHIQEVQA
jgi:uncharacterized protein YqgV (UPF0045/DUF77 family)